MGLHEQAHMDMYSYTLFLGYSRGLHSWKKWGFLKVGVKEAGREHGKVIWNELSPLLHVQQKHQTKLHNEPV